MMHDLFATWFHWVDNWGYFGVFLLMAMESSILPVPSELVIPPAAYWASQGRMNVAGVVLAGTVGSYVGAMVMYFASRWLGRPLVLRYGKYVFVPPDKLEKAERFLQRYEKGGVFFARLLPVVRHLIGIPAGIVRMPVGPYSLMTVVGAGLWCCVLAWFGQQVLGAERELLNDPNALVHALKDKLRFIVLGVVLFAALYFAMVRMTRKDDAPAAPPAA